MQMYIVCQCEDGVHWGIKRLNTDTGCYAWMPMNRGYETRAYAQMVCSMYNSGVA